MSVSVSSAQSAAVYLVDTATGTARATTGARLAAGSYLVEVAAASPRAPGSFTLTIAVEVSAGVAISGLGAAEATPALGDTTATVADGFTVTPAGAGCEATPAGATVTPTTGGTRTVSYDVPQGTTVTVGVAGTSGTRSATQTAQFAAGWAPVDISGFGHAVRG